MVLLHGGIFVTLFLSFLSTLLYIIELWINKEARYQCVSEHTQVCCGTFDIACIIILSIIGRCKKEDFKSDSQINEARGIYQTYRDPREVKDMEEQIISWTLSKPRLFGHYEIKISNNRFEANEISRHLNKFPNEFDFDEKERGSRIKPDKFQKYVQDQKESEKEKPFEYYFNNFNLSNQPRSQKYNEKMNTLFKHFFRNKINKTRLNHKQFEASKGLKSKLKGNISEKVLFSNAKCVKILNATCLNNNCIIVKSFVNKNSKIEEVKTSISNLFKESEKIKDELNLQPLVYTNNYRNNFIKEDSKSKINKEIQSQLKTKFTPDVDSSLKRAFKYNQDIIRDDNSNGISSENPADVLVEFDGSCLTLEKGEHWIPPLGKTQAERRALQWNYIDICQTFRTNSVVTFHGRMYHVIIGLQNYLLKPEEFQHYLQVPLPQDHTVKLMFSPDDPRIKSLPI